MRYPFVILALLAATPTALAQPAAPAPTVILHDADVFTADPARPRAQALAVRGERIVAVGTDAEILALAGPATTVLDLDGRLVVPGLNDAHVHVGPWPETRRLTLGEGPNADPAWDAVLDSVRAAVPGTPAGRWIMGSVGPRVLDDPRADRFALDTASPAHPVMLTGWTGHGLVLNTAALRELGIPEDAPDMPGGWYDRMPGTQTLSGRAWEYAHVDAARRLSRQQPHADAVAAYRRLTADALRWGITSIQHMETVLPLDQTLAGLEEAQVPLRWSLFDWPMPRRDVSEARPNVSVPAVLPRVRVFGTKWMLDGTPVERGAVMRAPYADRAEWYGRLNFSPAEIRAILRSGLDGDRQLAFHISGDSTLALVLRTMAELAPAETWRARRVRIEHGDGVMPDLVPLMVDLGVVLVQNPLHFAIPDVLLPRFGPERAPAYQLLRTPLEAGVPVAFGADAGGSGMNPFLNIMLAVMHPTNPVEALTLEQVLAAYTLGSAYAEGMEREKGTLAPGMLADLAVLSQNLFEVPLDALPTTESVLTMIGGEVVFRADDAGTDR